MIGYEFVFMYPEVKIDGKLSAPETVGNSIGY